MEFIYCIGTSQHKNVLQSRWSSASAGGLCQFGRSPSSTCLTAQPGSQIASGCLRLALSMYGGAVKKKEKKRVEVVGMGVQQLRELCTTTAAAAPNCTRACDGRVCIVDAPPQRALSCRAQCWRQPHVLLSPPTLHRSLCPGCCQAGLVRCWIGGGGGFGGLLLRLLLNPAVPTFFVGAPTG